MWENEPTEEQSRRGRRRGECARARRRAGVVGCERWWTDGMNVRGIFVVVFECADDLSFESRWDVSWMRLAGGDFGVGLQRLLAATYKDTSTEDRDDVHLAKEHGAGEWPAYLEEAMKTSWTSGALERMEMLQCE
jgi:hypothetical protein